MGAGGASTGGGGGAGPAGIKTDGTYGTKKDAKKTSRRNEFRTFVKEGGMIGKVVRGVTGKTPYELNLERRQKFVKSKGLTSEEINLDPSYLGSTEGLAELKKQGYTTASDTKNKNDGGNDQSVEPVIVKKNIGGTEVQTTQAKIDDQRAKDNEYDIRKVKKRGRRNILTSSKGVTTVSSDYSLGKRSLLGSV